MRLRRIVSALLAAQCLTVCSVCAFAAGDDTTIETVSKAESQSAVTTPLKERVYTGTPPTRVYVTTSAENLFTVTTSAEELFDVVVKESPLIKQDVHVTTSAEDIFVIALPDIKPIKAPEMWDYDIAAPAPDILIAAPDLLIAPPPIKAPEAPLPVTTAPLKDTRDIASEMVIHQREEAQKGISLDTPEIIARVEEYTDNLLLTTEMIARVEEHGDLNGDDIISSSDAAFVLNAVVNGVAETLENADFNNDGSVNVLDASVILKYIVENL